MLFFFSSRCCVKGSLLEVNERLIKQPQLLNSSVRDKYLSYHTFLLINVKYLLMLMESTAKEG